MKKKQQSKSDKRRRAVLSPFFQPLFGYDFPVRKSLKQKRVHAHTVLDCHHCGPEKRARR